MAKSLIKKRPVKKKKPSTARVVRAGAIPTGGGHGTEKTSESAFSGTGCIGCPESFTDAPKPIAEAGAIPIATGGTQTSYNLDQGGMANVATSCAQGGALKTGGGITSGGALKTGGRLRTGGKMDVDKTLQFVTSDMTYPEAIHTLGSMDDETYYMLQGLGGSFLSNVDHPLKEPYIKHFGGGFQHPGGISKVATMDILKSETPRKLAQMLYSEWKDKKRGHKVGGGLLDSLKNIFSKGVSGVKRGSKAAYRAGQKLHSALEKGIAVAEQLASVVGPVAKHIPQVNVPGIGNVDVGSLVNIAGEQAKQASESLGTALQVAGDVGKIISPAPTY